MNKHTRRAWLEGLLFLLLALPLAAMSAPDEVLKYWPEEAGQYGLPKAVHSAGKKVEAAESVLAEDDQSARLGNGDELAVDFGAVTGGFFEFKFNLTKPAKIRITYSEAAKFSRGESGKLSLLSLVDKKLLQRTYEVKQGGWFRDPVLMGGARYVMLEVLSGELDLDAIRCEKTFFQCDPKGQGWFLSSDQLLNKIWYAGYYTTCLDTIRPDQGGSAGRDKIGEGDWVMVDGAKRDRLIWSGDLGIADRVVYVSSGRYDLAKNSLLSLAAWQFNNGLYPACSRVELGAKAADQFLEYSFWQVINSYEYYLYSGDLDFLAKIYPGLLRAMEYHDRKTDSNGMTSQHFLRGGMNYSYSIIRTGPVAYTTALYYISLVDAARIAMALEDLGQAQLFLTRADRIEGLFNDYFWQKKTGVYRDLKRDLTHHALDGNVFAILSGLADQGKAEQALDFINRTLRLDWGDRQFDQPYVFPRKVPFAIGHNSQYVMPYINAFDAVARFRLGRDQEALDLIRRCWGRMAEQDPNFTDWEWIGKKGSPDHSNTSLTHGWSAGSTFILSEWVLGVRPVDPGFSQYLINPRIAGLEWAQGAVPTPRGLIEVNWKDSADRFEITLNLPAGPGPSLILPGKGDLVKISLNDAVIYDGKSKIPNPALVSVDPEPDRVGVELKEGGGYRLIIEKIGEVSQ